MIIYSRYIEKTNYRCVTAAIAFSYYSRGILNPSDVKSIFLILLP
jgi:hypothetical protein